MLDALPEVFGTWRQQPQYSQKMGKYSAMINGEGTGHREWTIFSNRICVAPMIKKELVNVDTFGRQTL